MRTRIILRHRGQRGDEFICYVVERRRWFGWERSPLPHDTIANAESYAARWANDKEYETVVKEMRYD